MVFIVFFLKGISIYSWADDNLLFLLHPGVFLDAYITAEIIPIFKIGDKNGLSKTFQDAFI